MDHNCPQMETSFVPTALRTTVNASGRQCSSVGTLPLIPHCTQWPHITFPTSPAHPLPNVSGFLRLEQLLELSVRASASPDNLAIFVKRNTCVLRWILILILGDISKGIRFSISLSLSWPAEGWCPPSGGVGVLSEGNHLWQPLTSIWSDPSLGARGLLWSECHILRFFLLQSFWFHLN